MKAYGTAQPKVADPAKREIQSPSPRSAARWLAVGLALFGAAATAAPVVIPNGNFSSAANDGSLGGGVLGASGSGLIGLGPWNGTYAGLLGLLAPPVLTISHGPPGHATISNLAAAVLLNNRGDFSQTLAAPYVPFKHYVLAADVTAGSVALDLGVLSSGNVGLALTSGASTLGSTQSPGALISLTLRPNTVSHVALGYDSTVSDSGGIGIALFADPTGGVRSPVTFSNVVLTQAPIPSLPPSSIAPASGTPQAATILTAFSAPLVVSVQDAQGNPLEGITVTFTVPSSGPGTVLSSTTVMTDVGGMATVTGTANGTAGSYTVIASVSGLVGTAAFNLRNSALGEPPVIVEASGNQAQAATVGTAFACHLGIKIVVGSTPAQGVPVEFDAPLTGASATLSDGTSSGPVLTETTDTNGIAVVSATANSTAGSYDITAILRFGPFRMPLLLATYPRTNLAVGDRIFANGFDPRPNCGAF